MHYTYTKTSKYTLSFFSGNLDDRAKSMVSLKSAYQNYVRNIKKLTKKWNVCKVLAIV